MARAATSPELAYYRTPGKWSKLYAAILKPPIVYRARVNQTFSTLDQVISLTYDTGTGTLANVLPDMEVWVGSSADSHDKGICRLRDRDATKFYVSETSEITFADNDYITIVASFNLWARPVRVVAPETIYMDETTYTDQHTKWDPMPNMGPHKVAELTGAAVNVGFSASGSFCPGSSISSYAWSCSTASGVSGDTTDTVTFQFNTTGWHVVYLTVTAANGKSFFGVRYVYIWNEANPPATAVINSADGDVDSGGWQASITLQQGASLSDVYERAMVILFSKDFYGATQANIGPVAGAENIRFVGWIAKEEDELLDEAGSVTFTAYGAAYWMNIIPSWPDGVEFVNITPTKWTSVLNLTVDLGLYHFLRWRTTATRIMDVTLTGDTRLTQEVSSSAQKLWTQIQEMAWDQIYARSGVNALNQLSISIHPSLIPSGSRTFPTVMTVTMEDIQEGIEIERLLLPEVSILDLSGVIVTAPNTAAAKFALAPGHSLPHYGDWDIQTNLLLSSQSQAITLAGLYRSWRNNPYKDIPLRFVAPIALIDCFPNQRCNLTLPTTSNVRGFSFSGGIIPTKVEIEHDAATGYMNYKVSFEAETFESQARQGDVPGSTDTDNPPSPTFPPLPLPPIYVPGSPPTTTEGGPKRVLFVDATGGLIYTENFNTSSPTYIQVNAGLNIPAWGTPPYLLIQRLHVCPGGPIYVSRVISNGSTNWGEAGRYFFVARAPYPGGTFEFVTSPEIMGQVIGYYDREGVYAVGVDPTVPERYAYADVIPTRQNIMAHIGSQPGGFVDGQAGLPGTGGGDQAGGSFTYGNNIWTYVMNNSWVRLNAAGTGVINSGATSIIESAHFNREADVTIRASSSPIIFNQSNGNNGLVRSDDNFATLTKLSIPDGFGGCIGLGVDPTGTHLAGRWGYGSAKGKSNDGGYSWSGFPSLPVGNWYFAFGGMNGSSPTWIAAGGAIRFSPDNGVTWIEKTSNSYFAINPIPGIYGVKVLEY